MSLKEHKTDIAAWVILGTITVGVFYILAHPMKALDMMMPPAHSENGRASEKGDHPMAGNPSSMNVQPGTPCGGPCMTNDTPNEHYAGTPGTNGSDHGNAHGGNYGGDGNPGAQGAGSNPGGPPGSW